MEPENEAEPEPTILSEIFDFFNSKFQETPNEEIINQIKDLRPEKKDDTHTIRQINFIVDIIQKNDHLYYDLLKRVSSLQDTAKQQLNKNIPFFLEQIKKSDVGTTFYKCCSCLIGLMAADAIGSFCEFGEKSRDNVNKIWIEENPNFHTKPGQVTDDSEMALSLMYSIMDGRAICNIEQQVIYFYYGFWTLTNPIDIGITTKKSFETFNRTEDKSLTNEKMCQLSLEIAREDNLASLSNGFLMRIAPFAVWLYIIDHQEIQRTFQSSDIKNFIVLYNRIKAEAKLDINITHPNIKATYIGAIYVFTLLNALCGSSSYEILNNLRKLIKAIDKSIEDGEKDVANKFIQSLNLSKNTTSCDPMQAEMFNDVSTKRIGSFIHAINLLIFYLSHFETIVKEEGDLKKVFKRIMNEICSLGGDTDTNGVIVFGVLGILIGYDNFPSEAEEVILFVSDFNRKRYLYCAGYAIYFVHFLESR